jgi:hypothetical protein
MVAGTLGSSHNAHNRGVVDIEAPGNASQTFAADAPSTDNLANLMGRQFWFATQSRSAIYRRFVHTTGRSGQLRTPARTQITSPLPNTKN